ncbi:MAG: hypothetical protein LUQ25_08130 [Methanoregulaceae archaeon]|nr:hypothetical protein [Methanoregulaceae archaeon]
MQKKLLVSIGLCIVVILIIIAVVTFGRAPSALPEVNQSVLADPGPLNCSGNYFAFITRNFTSPITTDEINATEERVIGQFVKDGGVRPIPGAMPEIPASSRIVAYGYYIEPNGTPHAFYGAIGNLNMEPYALANSRLWYEDTILGNAMFTNRVCTG